ncbi:histone-lysine N-methyltransferase EHMT1a isoform X4 [Cyprinodon tularosa]|uniref:histone-lysine N-methyltransferase EHMT1a isoform X4 n=1 Tax=Cyprinodon tularosa TaxID=77115 RepID=UPI0018E2727D|nr:histone-lysine N-methyltransferase EHMT1a isoform X4 [Cyprinodon tularosa]
METNGNHMAAELKRSPSPGSTTPKGKEAKINQKAKFTLTPFHRSPIISNNSDLQRKVAQVSAGKELPPRCSLISAFAVGLATKDIEQPPQGNVTAAATATNSRQLVPSSGSAEAMQEGEAQHSDSFSKTSGRKTPKPTPKDNIPQAPFTAEPHLNQQGMGIEVSASTQAKIVIKKNKKKKRKMGIYSLVPKKKIKTVKHQEKGSFMECKPYGSISHRFHRDCASILNDCRFCPHCGGDASGAMEVMFPKPDPSTLVPKSNHEALPPVVTTLPLATSTPVVPHILKARKSSQPQKSRDASQTRLKRDAVHPKVSLETVLLSLDDENTKLKKMKGPNRQLYVSAKQGDLQMVIQLLVDGKDPNLLMEGHKKRTALHAAAAEGHQEVCHMLVQAGANLEVFDEEQRTPLIVACENNHLDTVKYLVRAGAAVGHKDIMGFTCLHLAAKMGHYDVANHLLIKAPKYINCQDNGGWTPITWAIEYKHKELVHLFLKKRADVNIRDKEENVGLHWAALSGCDGIAQALLETGCDLNAVSVHGDTPLHIAARANHLKCVMLFLSHGADVSQKNKEGYTALDLSVSGSKVWTALNTNQKLTDARRERDCRIERQLSRDISRGFEAVPISCVNGVDNEPCPENFKYIQDNFLNSSLHMDKDITHFQHCRCTDDCSSSSCLCGQLSLRCWYDSEGRLPLDFCEWEPPVLFECNLACSCWRTCRNRVVQNGLRVRLQLYKTEKMGWGVRALQDIPQGKFICEYIGEIISNTEADKRENDSFLFTLDNKVGEPFCLDANLFGNIGRFINHLCEPNLIAVRVFTIHQDLRFPRIAFFSSKPIKAGEQIGIDYGDNYWRVKSKYFSCLCGSLKCHHSNAGR